MVRYGGTVHGYGGTVRWYGTVVRYGGTVRVRYIIHIGTVRYIYRGRYMV